MGAEIEYRVSDVSPDYDNEYDSEYERERVGRAMGAFPQDFLWGTSQSGHSIEGANFASDWWRWEQRTGRVAHRATSEEAAHFFENYHKDLDQARGFGHNAFLFSLEWSRVQPEPDKFDESAIEIYRGIFEALKKRNLEAVCALNHVTLPRWFAERFGWHHAEARARFRVYAGRVIAEFAPLCRWWVPIREPEHWITMACLEGRWPGPKHGALRASASRENMARAHTDAYTLLHAAREDAMVGVGMHARRFLPADANSPWDLRACLREARRCNHAFVQEVPNSVDFVGVAYYGREYLRFDPFAPGRRFARMCDASGKYMDGPVFEPDPDGLVETLRELSVYKKPLLITANGLGADDDAERCRYLQSHAQALRRALDEGLDVRGYFHRSLLDGFEWEAGYSKPFGLVHVDRARQTRAAKPSAALFCELIRTGTISTGALGRHTPRTARGKHRGK